MPAPTSPTGTSTASRNALANSAPGIAASVVTANDELDVYLAVARGLGVDPKDCVAIEDSTNGIKSAVAAGMRTIAVPNPHFPPADDALATAAVVVQSLAEVTPELVASL